MAPIILILVSACSNEDSSKQLEKIDQQQIEAIINDNVIDPTSVLFGTVVISENSNRACIEYNAKNTFGGYAGKSIAEFKKAHGVWSVIELKGSSYNCDTKGFKLLDIYDEAHLKAEETLVDVFQKTRSMSKKDATKFATRGMVKIDGKLISCLGTVTQYKVTMSLGAQDKYNNRESARADRAQIMLNFLNEGKCPGYREIDSAYKKMKSNVQ